MTRKPGNRFLGRIRIALLAGIVLALVAATAIAWAEEAPPPQPSPYAVDQYPPDPEIPEQLRDLWAQLVALREEHEEIKADLRAQVETNHNLAQQIRDEAELVAGPLKRLISEYRAFRHDVLVPLRQEAAGLRDALREAITASDRELARRIREQLTEALAELERAHGQAAGMAAEIRERRQEWAEVSAILRECHAGCASLRGQARAIHIDIAQLRVEKNAAWQEFVAALEMGDLDAAEEALTGIISLKGRIIDLTEDIHELAEETGQILEQTLSRLSA